MNKIIQKKKFNKKYLLPMIAILGIALVSAAIGYYAMFSATITVAPSITLSEDCSDTLSALDGEITIGSDCTLTNVAETERNLVITNDADTIEGIDVSYKGTLELTKKDSGWNPIGKLIEVEYTVIGNEFEVTGVEKGYTAIYYKDEVVGLEGRVANPQPAISIVGAGNLPHLNDANIDELADYTQSPDFYNQMKGAKLWIIPDEDLDGSTLNWANMADYYYETDLIQYNADGKITLYPEASLTITPVYTIAPGVEGTYEVNTTIA